MTTEKGTGDGIWLPGVLRSKVSQVNSTTAILGAAEVFTGKAEEIYPYGAITILGFSDVASASGGLSLESSIDGVNWDSQLPVTLAANTRAIHTLAVISHYFRVVYTNGSTAQTEFRLEVIYHPTDRKLTSRMNSVISADYDVQLVRTASDPKLDRALGLFSNQKGVHVFGANHSIGNSTTKDITEGGVINWLTVATTIRVKAGGNSADDDGGLGAATIRVEGLDANFLEIEEDITLAGTSASSATSKSFIRVSHAFVLTSGTYAPPGKNTAAIIIEDSAGSADIIEIEAGAGHSETSNYTIPAKKIGIITRWEIETAASKPIDVHFYQRPNADDVTAPYSARRLIGSVLQLEGVEDDHLDTYRKVLEKTDLWWEGTTGSGGGSVAVDYDLILVDD